MMLRRAAFDSPEVHSFFASLPADVDRNRLLEALADAGEALFAARNREGELATELAANTDALLTATGKVRDHLLNARARHAAERDVLPSKIETLTRRHAEALIAACRFCYPQAVQVRDEADDALAAFSRERAHLAAAVTLLDSESRYKDQAAGKWNELLSLDQQMRPHRDRGKQAIQVAQFITGTPNGLLGDGVHTLYVAPDRIESYVRSATPKGDLR
jgi:hypothetical protein